MKKYGVVTVLVCLLVVLTLCLSVAVVPAGHTGVVTKFGAVTGDVLDEGLHFKVPFVTKVKSMDNRIAKADEDVASASKDLQTVSSTISVNYRVARDSSAALYQNVGYGYESTILRPAVQECSGWLYGGRTHYQAAGCQRADAGRACRKSQSLRPANRGV